jgi:mycothiol synthase
MDVMVRQYDPMLDGEAVWRVYEALGLGRGLRPPLGFMLVVAGQVVGVVGLGKYEGLPHLTAVSGGILPPYRRQGYGTTLLTAVITYLQPQQQAIALETNDWHSPAAQFARARGFLLEHEEICYERPADTPPLPPLLVPDGFHIAPPQGKQSNTTFTGLYRRSFSPHPWFQPYDPSNLPPLNGMLFLYHGANPIGFAWTITHPDGVGQVEPLGVEPAYQGRGHGRVLLNAALHHLHRQTCHTYRIITWTTNQPARQLYESFGFQDVGRTYHLLRPHAAPDPLLV